MKILMLLLHDERFSGWTIKNKLFRHHFSLEYLHFCTQKGWDALLYTFHQHVKTVQIYDVHDAGVIKIFPVEFRFPPFRRFGNDHNLKPIIREALADAPDLVHFHDYYLYSFPYTAAFVKGKLKRPVIVQLHGYNNTSLQKWLHLPCLFALRNVDLILYSYEPEETVYRKLGVLEKAVRIPVPGVDTGIFRRQRRCASNRLLYVGRIPRPERACGEKSPFLLLHLLRGLLDELKDVALDVVGDGPGLGYCRRLAHKLDLEEHISFHGYVPHDELPKYYRAAALTLSPIRVYDVDGWFDGAIQESLACGTPVAAFKTSPRAPLQGTYGYLLSNDLEKAAKELSILLKTPEDMDPVAADGSRFVHENCAYGKVATELQEAWGSVIQR